MATNYPASLDTFPDVTGTVDRMDDPGKKGSELINNVMDAIGAVQTELGIDPAGSEATVSDRLDTLAPLDSPSLTGTPTAPTPADANDSSTKIPTTSWVRALVLANVGNGGAYEVYAEDKGAGPAETTATNTAAVLQAITDAGVGGRVMFRSLFEVQPNAIKPLNSQVLTSLSSAEGYAWRGDEPNRPGQCGMYATGSGYIIGNPNTTSNGESSTQASRGVRIENLCLFGDNAAGGGSLVGIDFGPVYSGPERSWTVQGNRLMYFGTAIAGYMWVSRILNNQIARNGWGISPHRGTQGGIVNDSVFENNWIYFNRDGGLELAGANEHGAVKLVTNRFERSGALITGQATYDPSENAPVANAYAPGIYMSRAHIVNMIGNTTDANTGPGLRIEAAAQGDVNFVNGKGNHWNRDGIGANDGNPTIPAVHVRYGNYITLHDSVSWGKPNDGGTGYDVPHRGVHFDQTWWSTWDGPVELPSGYTTTYALVQSNDNYKSIMVNPRTTR